MGGLPCCKSAARLHSAHNTHTLRIIVTISVSVINGKYVITYGDSNIVVMSYREYGKWR